MIHLSATVGEKGAGRAPTSDMKASKILESVRKLVALQLIDHHKMID